AAGCCVRGAPLWCRVRGLRVRAPPTRRVLVGLLGIGVRKAERGLHRSSACSSVGSVWTSTRAGRAMKRFKDTVLVDLPRPEKRGRVFIHEAKHDLTSWTYMFVSSDAIEDPACARDENDPTSAFAQYLLPRLKESRDEASREVLDAMKAGRPIGDAVID